MVLNPNLGFQQKSAFQAKVFEHRGFEPKADFLTHFGFRLSAIFVESWFSKIPAIPKTLRFACVLSSFRFFPNLDFRL
jgi:hypothetical protein